MNDNELLAHEAAELNFLTNRYREERANRNFAYSDLARRQLVSAGVVNLDKEPKWHPTFEDSGPRMKRLRGRTTIG